MVPSSGDSKASRRFGSAWQIAMAGLLVACLTLAVGLQVGGWKAKAGHSRGVHLAAALPTELNHSLARDIPLGPTENGDEVVRRVLQCDDVVYRGYSTAHGDFEVYVAYWAPNKVPPELVASHTPDRCWSDNGWTCTEMKFAQDYTIGERKLQPAEWRTFSPPGGSPSVHLIYWHITGKTPYRYGRSFNWAPNPFHYWEQHANYIVFGASEQYFVRLTSTRDFNELWPDADFQKVLQSLADLVLAKPAHS